MGSNRKLGSEGCGRELRRRQKTGDYSSLNSISSGSPLLHPKPEAHEPPHSLGSVPSIFLPLAPGVECREVIVVPLLPNERSCPPGLGSSGPLWTFAQDVRFGSDTEDPSMIHRTSASPHSADGGESQRLRWARSGRASGQAAPQSQPTWTASRRATAHGATERWAMKSARLAIRGPCTSRTSRLTGCGAEHSITSSRASDGETASRGIGTKPFSCLGVSAATPASPADR